MKHIKYTTSVCPQCLKCLDAEVREEQNGIFLARACPEHGEFYNIVERDINFYKAAANINKKRFIKEANFLIMPITDKCNQKCKFCYYPNYKNEYLSTEEIIKIASSGPPLICLSGGEPTLHPDLPVIINKLEKMGKRSKVLTNGLRLADLDFVKSLKAAGLKAVVLSLNGFSNHILEQIDNAPCLEEKLKAIDNLKAEGIKIEFSLSLLRGVNEGELKKAINFCLENIGCIPELRVRSFSQIGRSQNIPTVTAGEMIALLSDALSIRKEKLINGIRKRRFSSARQYNAALCFLSLNGRFIFLTELDLFFTGPMKSKPLRSLVAVLKTLNTRGIKIFVKTLFNIFSDRGKIVWLTINMYSWLDKFCLDLEEINSTGATNLTSKNEIDNFLKVLILDNRQEALH